MRETIESLRQQLSDTKLLLGQAMTTVDELQKSNVMARGALKRLWDEDDFKYIERINEALAATADLENVRLCEKESVAVGSGVPLYRAWEPKP